MLGTLANTQFIPLESLPVVLGALCQLSRIGIHANQCLEICQSILNSGAAIGLYAVTVLTGFLSNEYPVQNILQGAVYLLSQASWGTIVLNSLVVRAEVFLPYFLVAVRRKLSGVNLEVARSLHAGVVTEEVVLTPSVWDVVVDILEELGTLFEPVTYTLIDAIISKMEIMYVRGRYPGEVDRLFEISDGFPGTRDLSVVLEYKTQFLHLEHDNWLENATLFMQKYFRHDIRPDVKLKVLIIMEQVMQSVRYLYDDALISHALLPAFSSLASEPDSGVQTNALLFIARVASENDLHFDAFMKLIMKVVKGREGEDTEGRGGGITAFTKLTMKVVVPNYEKPDMMLYPGYDVIPRI